MSTENEPRKEVYDSRYDGLIERMPEMEEGIGITLDCISVNSQKGSHVLKIFCEARSVPGKRFKFNIDLNGVLYDLTGRIVDKNDRRLYPDDWMGFAVKEFCFCNLPPRQVAGLGKIRVFPAKA